MILILFLVAVVAAGFCAVRFAPAAIRRDDRARRYVGRRRALSYFARLPFRAVGAAVRRASALRLMVLAALAVFAVLILMLEPAGVAPSVGAAVFLPWFSGSGAILPALRESRDWPRVKFLEPDAAAIQLRLRLGGTALYRRRTGGPGEYEFGRIYKVTRNAGARVWFPSPSLAATERALPVFVDCGETENAPWGATGRLIEKVAFLTAARETDAVVSWDEVWEEASAPAEEVAG